MTITQDQLDYWFTYHNPGGDSAKIAAYERLRKAGREFATTIVECTPACADQTAAVRKVREAVMTANAAIACEGI